jgi:hypothetical protein
MSVYFLVEELADETLWTPQNVKPDYLVRPCPFPVDLSPFHQADPLPMIQAAYWNVNNWAEASARFEAAAGNAKL